jgi:hypothetical protein
MPQGHETGSNPRINTFSNNSRPEPVFANVYGAKESIPRNSPCSLAGRYGKQCCRTGMAGWESIHGLLKRPTNSGFVQSGQCWNFRTIFGGQEPSRNKVGCRAGPPKPVFVNFLRSPGIDSQHAESIPRNRYLGSINVYKYGLRLHRLAESIHGLLKETVSRDFLLLVFFMNQFPPNP